MPKRKGGDLNCEFEEPQGKQIKFDVHMQAVKHTLDSDEDDSADEESYNVMNENEIEGEEEGVSGMEGDVKFTPFNMREELEEGHFDLEGHFHWDKSKEIKDNWLDNIDWVKVKTDKQYVEKEDSSLVDSSESEDEQNNLFDERESYKMIFDMMQPGETINKTLQRLGKKSAMLSSVERWKQKKAGIIDESSELITKLTELANVILTKTGNMDIYDETYEVIESKMRKYGERSKLGKTSSELDMYSDDFVDKEKSKLGSEITQEESVKVADSDVERNSNDIQWEFKWKQDAEEIYGPYPTEQMLNWVEEGYFKIGVFVRKVGDDTKFYSSSRIDFGLYL